MARIGYLVYCGGGESNPGAASGRSAYLSNPMPEICLPFLPTAYSLGLAVGLADIATAQIDGTHNLRICCEYESGRKIFDSGDMPLRWPAGLQVGKVSGMQVYVDMRNVVFEERGELVTKVFFDGESIGEYKTLVTVVGAEGDVQNDS